VKKGLHPALCKYLSSSIPIAKCDKEEEIEKVEVSLMYALQLLAPLVENHTKI
jgi:E3 ubiquitin-protein ligase UBR4